MYLVNPWKADNVDSSRFSDLKVVPPVTFCKASKKIDRLVTFVFRYRPLGGLLAIFSF